MTGSTSMSRTTGTPVRRSVQERAAAGKAARAAVPRGSHGEYGPAPDRQDPVALLQAQSATRVPELVPIRYGRMIESPFRFYRGAAGIMAADLAAGANTGIRAQLCGDAHLLNFRLLASPERRLMFDINDFDETLPGPWEWDVKRLAASLVIASRENGFTAKERSAIVRATVRSYREQMRGLALMGNLDVWYARIDTDGLQDLVTGRLDARRGRLVARSLDKARTRDNLQAFEKLTHLVDGQRRITAAPPLVVPVADLLPELERGQLEHAVGDLVARYATSLQSDHRILIEQYRLVDMARKVVGVGSVGTRCWIVLLLGRDDQDPLLLQIKEADHSVLAPYAGASAYPNQGRRVVAGQRLMQASSDIFLGWQRAEAGIADKQRDFYVRQLRDWKFSIDIEDLAPRDMRIYGQACGWTLARAHARSGDRIAIAAYLGSSDVFDHAITQFASAYADQNERDHQALVHAVDTNQVPARTA